MRRSLILVAIAVLLPAAALSARAALTLRRIAGLESGFDLIALEAASPGHEAGHAPKPLGEYVRYYSEDRWRERSVIRGHYVLAGIFADDKPGTRWGRGPEVFDGGCSVVQVLFDAESGEALVASCNGVG